MSQSSFDDSQLAGTAVGIEKFKLSKMRSSLLLLLVLVVSSFSSPQTLGLLCWSKTVPGLLTQVGCVILCCRGSQTIFFTSLHTSVINQAFIILHSTLPRWAISTNSCHLLSLFEFIGKTFLEFLQDQKQDSQEAKVVYTSLSLVC